MRIYKTSFHIFTFLLFHFQFSGTRRKLENENVQKWKSYENGQNNLFTLSLFRDALFRFFTTLLLCDFALKKSLGRTSFTLCVLCAFVVKKSQGRAFFDPANAGVDDGNVEQKISGTHVRNGSDSEWFLMILFQGRTNTSILCVLCSSVVKNPLGRNCPASIK